MDFGPGQFHRGLKPCRKSCSSPLREKCIDPHAAHSHPSEPSLAGDPDKDAVLRMTLASGFSNARHFSLRLVAQEPASAREAGKLPHVSQRRANVGHQASGIWRLKSRSFAVLRMTPANAVLRVTPPKAVPMKLYTVSAVFEPCCGVVRGDSCEGLSSRLFECFQQTRLGRAQ